MITETTFRIAFLILFLMLITMRAYFMVKVRRSGGRIMPDEEAIKREGGRGVFIFRVIMFFALMAFLVMYILGAKWIDAFRFQLPVWLRWFGFALGILSVAFMTWTQVTLDTQWSAQLQLSKDHHLVTAGPYARVRHPLYSSVFGWGLSLALLIANWIFVAVTLLSIAGLLWRIPKEEQMMLEAFGEEYKIYMGHTGRFFPRLATLKDKKGALHA
ncbi:MAG TPA: isoprenylcysteine carboxylmethyltransferase family protein [Anaerolineales bacterium]|nr:isoprenylcysteine carboxylmethyltransferase family protein [Anaerolineales bacterium]